MRTRTWFLISLTLCLAAPAGAQAPVELDSDDDRSIYLIGASLGRNVVSLALDDREVAILERGFEDSVKERELAVDPDTFGPKVNAFVDRRNKRTASAEKVASQKLLDAAAKEKGAVTTESGLIYIEEKAGAGAQPKATDTVKVHYHGTRSDGSVFDSSRNRGEPVTFELNRVIPCWTEALQRMKPGGEAVIFCPAEIAYGDRGFRGIRPGAALRFEVELIAVE